MRGDNLKIKSYVKEYGSDFCVDAIQRAIAVKDAEDMRRGKAINTMNRKQAEARILDLASELGVRIKR